MTQPPEPFDFACACKLGRILAGHDPITSVRQFAPTLEYAVKTTAKKVLEKNGGNYRKAAQALGVNYGTLYRWFPTPKNIVRMAACLVVLAAAPTLAMAQTLLPLLPQKNLAFSAPVYTGNKVTLAWERSPSTNVVGYRIYFAASFPPTQSSATVGNVTNTTIDNLTAGLTYYFQCVAYAADGVESPPSNTVTNYIETKVAIAPYVFRVTGNAPNKTNLWQISTNATTWQTVKTVVTTSGAPIELLITNNLPTQLVRLR